MSSTLFKMLFSLFSGLLLNLGLKFMLIHDILVGYLHSELSFYTSCPNQDERAPSALLLHSHRFIPFQRCWCKVNVNSIGWNLNFV